MAAKQRVKVKPGMSDEAVQAKTGKTWAEWFSALDADGGRRLSHKEIVAIVGQKYGLGAWWQQMVTVTYEQARGLRAKHERPDGYQVSATKTVAVPVARLYRAWKTEKARTAWLAEPALAVRSSTPEKSLYLDWVDGKTRVAVNFYAKGEAKSQVAVEHSRLPGAAAAEKQKTFWKQALESLKAKLEKDEG